MMEVDAIVKLRDNFTVNVEIRDIRGSLWRLWRMLMMSMMGVITTVEFPDISHAPAAPVLT